MNERVEPMSVSPEPTAAPETEAAPGTEAAPETTASPEGKAAPGTAARAPLPAAPDLRPRPLIERIGMAAIAVVIGAVFSFVALAAFVGGEPFLGIMGAAGALLVLWVGGLTLIRG